MAVSSTSRIHAHLSILCTFSVQIVKDGKKRKLIFKDVKITDAGMIKCTTNADKTEGELAVECKPLYTSLIMRYIWYINTYVLCYNFRFP